MLALQRLLIQCTNMNSIFCRNSDWWLCRCWLFFDFQSYIPTFCQLREFTNQFMLALKDWFCKKTNIKRKSVAAEACQALIMLVDDDIFLQRTNTSFSEGFDVCTTTKVKDGVKSLKKLKTQNTKKARSADVCIFVWSELRSDCTVR